ncbi:MAG: hypothetical protein ACYDH5_16600 [Acidimicrobiales bacterium]
MIALLRAELEKDLSTRLWWALAIPVAVVAALLALPVALGPPAIVTAIGMPGLLKAGSEATPFVVAFAAIAFTTEFRHGTIVSTLLAVPDRAKIVATKLAAGAVIGVAYAALATAAGIATSVITLDVRGVDLPAVHHLLTQVVEPVGGTLLAELFYGAIAASIGGLIRHQIGAIVVVLVYVAVVEPLVTGLGVAFHHPGISIYLPGSLTTSLSGGLSVGTAKLPAGVVLPRVLSFWPAAGLFALYAVVFAVAAASALRLDIG